MALTKKIEAVDNFGEKIQFDGAIIKVSSLEGDKAGIVATLDIFKSDQTTLIKRIEVEFVPNLEVKQPNFIAQAYAYAKTLPEFSDAKDC